MGNPPVDGWMGKGGERGDSINCKGKNILSVLKSIYLFFAC